jgi:hypothetical protein
MLITQPESRVQLLASALRHRESSTIVSAVKGGCAMSHMMKRFDLALAISVFVVEA